jgi:hypothetical protein
MPLFYCCLRLSSPEATTASLLLPYKEEKYLMRQETLYLIHQNFSILVIGNILLL